MEQTIPYLAMPADRLSRLPLVVQIATTRGNCERCRSPVIYSAESFLTLKAKAEAIGASVEITCESCLAKRLKDKQADVAIAVAPISRSVASAIQADAKKN